MPINFAHGEIHVKRTPRYLRQEPSATSCYDAEMKLKIKQIRRAQKMTLEALADLVRLSPSYVSEIENGKKQCNGLRLKAFAAALGVSVHDLIDEGRDDQETADHLRTMALLSPEDQETVRRVAASLLRKPSGG
jgi:transcriptional regulator with XRE-family HTH domain